MSNMRFYLVQSSNKCVLFCSSELVGNTSVFSGERLGPKRDVLSTVQLRDKRIIAKGATLDGVCVQAGRIKIPFCGILIIFLVLFLTVIFLTSLVSFLVVTLFSVGSGFLPVLP